MADQLTENKQETKNRDRFVRIVENRVNRVLNDLDSLGNCSNRRNYEYTKKDVEKIFAEIEKKVNDVKSLFNENPEKAKTFKLE